MSTLALAKKKTIAVRFPKHKATRKLLNILNQEVYLNFKSMGTNFLEP